MRIRTLVAACLLAACGEDENLDSIDAKPPIDARELDAPIDAPAAFVPPTPVAVPLSATGTDQLRAAATGPGGSFYAIGFRAPGVAATDDRAAIVVKLGAAGALDPGFGTGGVAEVNLRTAGGGESATGLVVQPGGKIVGVGTVEHDPAATGIPAADRDLALFRLDAGGVLDPTFGDAGVTIFDASTAHDNGTALQGTDAGRAIAADGTGRLYVLGVQRGEGTAAAGGPRTDTDFLVARFTADGDLDPTWAGGDGKFLLDIQESGATPHAIHVLADGSVLVGGYANSVGLGSVQPVLFKLTPAGALDAGFAQQGLFHEIVLALQTEIYGLAISGNDVTTAGYGRRTGTQNDWVSLRFDVVTGARSTTFGGAPDGAVTLDPSGMMLGDNCRNALALPGGKTLLVGSAGPNNAVDQDAVFAVLTATGAADRLYTDDGLHAYDLGGNDQLWGAALSSDGTRALAVGWRGGGATPTATVNDDAYAVVLPLQ